MIVLQVLALITLIFILVKSSDLIIIAVRHISREIHTGTFLLATVVLAIGTTLPELFVAITSGFEHTSALSFGNVLGSNIANISLIAGVAGVVSGGVNVQGRVVKKDLLAAFMAGVLPLILVLDGSLTRIDGLVLVFVYIANIAFIFRSRYDEIAAHRNQENFTHRFFREFTTGETKLTHELLRFFIGLVILIGASDLVVKLAVSLSNTVGIPVFLIGLVVLSLGTTLPELILSLQSLRQKQPSIFFGNLLGSIVANSTLVLGIATLLHPIEVVAIGLSIKAAIFFLVIFIAFWYFIRSKLRLDMFESVSLVILYVFFLIVVFLN